ncbi:MAG: circadian clock protein KaiB [Acuticoccus sp.]
MKYWLRLYVTGRTPHSQSAIENLRQICAQRAHNEYAIEVIDVLEQPHLAEREKIVATPTLVRRLPEPVRKIIGDLSDRERVLIGLDLPVRPDDESNSE